MKKFMYIFLNPFISPIFIVFLFVFIILFAFIPYYSSHNKNELMINNAIQTINNIKNTRGYYSENIIATIKNIPNSNIKINFDYKTSQDTIPLPATFAHDIASFSTDKYKEIKLISNYPFPNRKNRILNDFEKESLSYLINNPEKIYARKVIENGVERFKISISDVFKDNSCVSCHNTREDSPKTDWKLGDVRGIFEITYPIEKDIVLTNNQTLIIISLMMIILFFLTVHYTIMSIKNNKNNEIKKQKLEQEIEKRTAELKNSLKLLNQYKLAVDSSAIVSKTDKNGKIIFVNEEFIKISKYSENELIGKNHNIIKHKDMKEDIFRDLWETIKSKRIWKGEIKNKAKDDSVYYVTTTIIPILDINDEIKEYLAIRLDVTKIVEAQLKAKKDDDAKSTFLANMSHEIRTPLNAIIGFSTLLSTSKELDTKNRKQAKTINSSAESLLSIINDILDISKIESGNFTLNYEEISLEFISEEVVELFSKKAIEKHIKLIFNIDNHIPKYVFTDSIRLKQVLSNLLSNAIKFTNKKGKVYLNISCIEVKENKTKVRFEIKDNGIGIPTDKIFDIFEPFIQIDNNSNKEYQGTGLGLSICSHIIKALNSEMKIESEIERGTKFYFDLEFDISLENNRINKTFPNYNYINFKVFDNSEMFDYYKNYLNKLGTIDDETKSIDILIANCSNKDLSTLNLLRKEFKEIPKLLIYEFEDDINHFELLNNERTLSLPFYPSKLNDSINELLNKEKEINSKETLKTYQGNVLIAEDNTTNKDLISYILESMGVQFCIKKDGLETLNEYKTNYYDLILMDISMPVMDGIEATKRIRKYEQENNLNSIPIIALTANAIKGDKENFLSLGMDGYVSKPINSEELKNIFNTFLVSKKISTKKEKTLLVNDNIRIIDELKIANKLGISKNIVKLIINKFKSEINKDLEELKDFINKNDIENISQKAHYIKNSCLNVALDEICEILQELEDKSLEESKKKELFDQLYNILGGI